MHCENGKSVIYLRKNYPNGQNCGIRLKESMLSLYILNENSFVNSFAQKAGGIAPLIATPRQKCTHYMWTVFGA